MGLHSSRLLALMRQTRAEGPDSDKHSSLLQLMLKKFYSSCLRTEIFCQNFFSPPALFIELKI